MLPKREPTIQRAYHKSNQFIKNNPDTGNEALVM